MPKQTGFQCVVCGQDQWRPDADASRITRVREGYFVVQCASCGLRRLDPMPNQDELRTFYEDDSLKHEYIRQNSSAYVAGADQAADYITERLQGLAAKLSGPGRILDIGAAQGAFLAQAVAAGWTGVGLELSTEGVELARQSGLDVRQKTLHEAAFDSDSFDAVHMSHVLEHLPDPKETLLEIRRVLRPNGILAIEVPNEYDDLFGAMRQTILRRPRPAYAVPSPHVYFYTPPTLRRLIEDSGFRVFHHSTPRRNADTSSGFPLAGGIRKAVFALEKMTRRGSLIETYAVKSGD